MAIGATYLYNTTITKTGNLIPEQMMLNLTGHIEIISCNLTSSNQVLAISGISYATISNSILFTQDDTTEGVCSEDESRVFIENCTINKLTCEAGEISMYSHGFPITDYTTLVVEGGKITGIQDSLITIPGISGQYVLAYDSFGILLDNQTTNIFGIAIIHHIPNKIFTSVGIYCANSSIETELPSGWTYPFLAVHNDERNFYVPYTRLNGHFIWSGWAENYTLLQIPNQPTLHIYSGITSFYYTGNATNATWLFSQGNVSWVSVFNLTTRHFDYMFDDGNTSSFPILPGTAYFVHSSSSFNISIPPNNMPIHFYPGISLIGNPYNRTIEAHTLFAASDQLIWLGLSHDGIFSYQFFDSPNANIVIQPYQTFWTRARSEGNISL
jgi:hypothetical protein